MVVNIKYIQCLFRFWRVNVTYRDRDFVNVSDRDLVQYDRFRPFTVPDHSPSLNVFMLIISETRKLHIF
jgi:hypothetical protein